MNVLLTGATSGLGFELVKILLLKKKVKKIICFGRNFQNLRNLNSCREKLLFIPCDFSKKKKIDNGIKKMCQVKKIDILINNAGTIFFKKEINCLNINKTVFINFVVPVYLFYCLKVKLLNSNRPRLINIVSDPDNYFNKSLKLNLNFWYYYTKSKFYLVLFTFFIKKRFTKINPICINPGRIKTNFGKDNNLLKFVFLFYHWLLGQETGKIAFNIVKIILKNKNSKKVFYNLKKNKNFIFKKKDDKLMGKIVKVIKKKLLEI